MSKPCKDCVKYNTIKRPDYYSMGVDNRKTFTYIIPVNDAISIGGLDSYYEDAAIWETAASPTYLLKVYASVYGYGIYDDINSAVSDISNDVKNTIPSFVDAIEIDIDNPNYGKPLLTDPSFLFWQYEQNQIPYSSLKDPTWLVSFPVCSIKNKFESNAEWRLKDCGVWKVSYRLRVRPLIPLTFYDPSFGDPCADYVFDTELPDQDTYKLAKEVMRFYKSLEAQEGSKALGIAPMRIESGIYSRDTLNYKPIVWSEGGYPQTLPNERLYWSKKYPKEMSWISTSDASSLTDIPFCGRQKWYIGPNTAPITTVTQVGNPNEENIIYSYTTNSNISVGTFKPTTNSLTNPGTLEFSLTDKIGGSSLVDWVNSFDFSGNGSKVAELEIEIQGRNITGPPSNWTTSTRLEFDVSTISIQSNKIVFTITSNSNNPLYEDNLDTGYSNTEFYNFSNYETRYLISISNVIPGETIPTFDIANVKPQTFTSLTEDFVFEIEGFTHVDLDKEKDISIYLKVLPEHNDYGSGGINYVHQNSEDRSVNIFPWYSEVDNNANLQSSVSPSGFWPWAPLSMDYRNGYTENLDVKYEPFLPLDLDRRNGANPENFAYDNQRFRRGYGLSDNTKGWYIMIEEGWVRAEKVCEDCEDC